MKLSTEAEESEITALLAQARGGRREALDAVFERLYPALRRTARSRMLETEGTLTPTVIVHEAWLRMSCNAGLSLLDRHHFMACAARAMRAVAVDHLRASSADKRGGGAVTITLSAALSEAHSESPDLLAIDQALDALDALDPAQRELVELHFFAGLQFQEIAVLRAVDERTVRRHWQRARAFLLAQVADPSGE